MPRCCGSPLGQPLGLCGSHHQGQSTHCNEQQLGSPAWHDCTLLPSHLGWVQGVDLFLFNADATKITEVQGEQRICLLQPVGARWSRGQRRNRGQRRRTPAQALRLPPSPRLAVYRSSWLGAQGHDERKKLAEAAARIEAQRGQLP